ncbi:unnamed protein product [Rotaria sordida]|uniref:Dynamin N-terminal domain-containing protein n=1 Tax=Rotaria sordida TaxID=392033 RepID=A0A819R0J7_9BILA|nr:unnamed protein product [Rotaria sordida]
MKISHHVETDKLNKITDELFPVLHDVCYFNFSRHRLSFASTVIEQLNALEQHEQKLLEIIEHMRDETHANDALNTEYDALKYSRKKIVLAVLGCAKSAKSSFINYLLEEKICPVDVLSATARVTRIIYGSQWKIYLEGEQGEEMNDIDSLYRKAIELIVLKGDDRNDETKYKMKVIIELPIKQLKNVELWDLPGLNENPVLDGIVSTILSDVDLVFALLPINEVAPTAAPNKTLTPTQKNVLSCGGNACIYCGDCRDWIYDDGVDCGNNHNNIFDRRRWQRCPDAKCFYGYHHFTRYYHHDDRDDDSIRFYNKFVRNRDLDADLFDDSESRFYGHFDNICKCV